MRGRTVRMPESAESRLGRNEPLFQHFEMTCPTTPFTQLPAMSQHTPWNRAALIPHSCGDTSAPDASEARLKCLYADRPSVSSPLQPLAQ
jgi:hypothetical protein